MQGFQLYRLQPEFGDTAARVVAQQITQALDVVIYFMWMHKNYSIGSTPY